MRSKLRVEKPVVTEARAVNRDVYRYVLQSYESVSNSEMLRTAGLKVTESFLDAIIYGIVAGRKSLRRSLKLSLKDRINRDLTSNEYNFLKLQFEHFSRAWSGHLRRDLGEVITNWVRIVKQEGYPPELSAKALRLAFKARGYSPLTARNIANVFRTGYYMGFNGIIFAETRNNPEVWGYRLMTAADEKVRANHWAQHRVTLPKTDPFWTIWWPPNGYNCRCGVDVLTDPVAIIEPNRYVTPDDGFSGNAFIQFSGV